MSLTIALEEFEALARAASELAERVRTARFVWGAVGAGQGLGHGFSHVSGQSAVEHPIERLETLAHRLRQTGHQYSGGEDLMSRVIGRLSLGLTPVAVAFTWLGSISGLLPSGAVALASSRQQACTPPQGFAGLLERIPETSSQVRIDRIEGDGHVRYIVYVAGTRDFGVHVSDDPWDMTSNLQALSNTALADSERAVRSAMAEAGIDAHTPVTLVGHSQGGLIVSRLAASADFTVTDVIVAGSPSHLISVPESIRVTAFEHSDDLIPVLSGPALATVSAATLFIREPAPPAARQVALPSHELQGYIATAKSADSSADPLLRARKQALTRTDNETCSTRNFQAKRGGR